MSVTLDLAGDDPWWAATRTVFANSYDVAAWETKRAMPGSGGGGGGVPREVRVAGAVFATLSRFNHSCAPNCSWSFLPGRGAAVEVRALRALRPGQELTVSYLAGGDPRQQPLHPPLHRRFLFIYNVHRAPRRFTW